MSLITLIIALIILAIGVVFSLLNSETVTVNYLFGKTILPLSLLLALTVVIGLVLGWLTSLPNRIQKRTQLFRLRRELKRYTEGDKRP